MTGSNGTVKEGDRAAYKLQTAVYTSLSCRGNIIKALIDMKKALEITFSFFFLFSFNSKQIEVVQAVSI